mgnify:CR=1 FL=1
MGNKYPVVLCHGMFGYGQQEITERLLPYFGLYRLNIRKMFNEQGVHCVAPSLGPFTGAWDRACECYAQLVGGTVDYGKVHSEKYGHARYGRTYKALLPEWGQKDSNGNIIKVNFIGHSFGGVTARLLTELLISGSQEEIDGTPENELSPLFKGGNADLVHSITTLASPHNGCSFNEKRTGKVMTEICILMCRVFGLLDGTPLQSIYDLNLDRFGITTKPGIKWELKDHKAELNKYFKENKDNICYDLTFKGAKELNEKIKTRDNIYYFSYRGQRTRPTALNLQVPGEHSFPVLNILGLVMGINPFGVPSTEWLANDLVINTVSGIAPDNAPKVDVETVKEYKPGIWHVMPLEIKDHMSYLGWAEEKETFRKFYQNIYDTVSNLK